MQSIVIIRLALHSREEVQGNHLVELQQLVKGAEVLKLREMVQLQDKEVDLVRLQEVITVVHQQEDKEVELQVVKGMGQLVDKVKVQEVLVPVLVEHQQEDRVVVQLILMVMDKQVAKVKVVDQLVEVQYKQVDLEGVLLLLLMVVQHQVQVRAVDRLPLDHKEINLVLHQLQREVVQVQTDCLHTQQ